MFAFCNHPTLRYTVCHPRSQPSFSQRLPCALQDFKSYRTEPNLFVRLRLLPYCIICIACSAYYLFPSPTFSLPPPSLSICLVPYYFHTFRTLFKHFSTRPVHPPTSIIFFLHLFSLTARSFLLFIRFGKHSLFDRFARLVFLSKARAS